MILVCFIGLAPFVFLLGSLQHADQMLLAVALCGMGFFGNMAWGPFLALPAEIFSPEVYGKAMGFVNGAGYFVAAFSAKIFRSVGFLVVILPSLESIKNLDVRFFELSPLTTMVR